MGPHATLADSTVRENIMTGIHFWGCKCCGTYNRHNEVVQVAFAYFKYELRFYGSTSSVDSNLVGFSAKGKRRHTDGQVWGSPFIPKRAAFDVGKEDPNAVSLQVPVHVAIHFSTRMQGPDLQRSRKLTTTKS